MAIQKPTEAKNYTLQEEIASRVMLLTRDVIDNGNGTITTMFGAEVYPKSITYELDADNNKIGIYDSKDLQSQTISFMELMSLFAIPVTLKDGTTTAIGEVISSFIDQILASKLGLTENVTITTQPIDMSAELPDPTPTPNPTPTPDPTPTPNPTPTPDPTPTPNPTPES